MSQTTTILPATQADAVPLAQILGAWVQETDWMPRLYSAAENYEFLAWHIASHRVLVARVGIVPQGFISLKLGEVPLLYVARQARGCGLGHDLLEHAKQDRDRLALWTFQRNDAARRFYAREGFCEVEETDGARNAEKLPDVRCVWTRNGAGHDG